MLIYYRYKQLRKICDESKEAVRKLGKDMAEKLELRLDQLRAATVLADIPICPPARRHQMKGDREGQFSVDLKHPRRLFFIPAEEEIPRMEDGGIDIHQVKEIEIVEIEDPHPRR